MKRKKVKTKSKAAKKSIPPKAMLDADKVMEDLDAAEAKEDGPEYPLKDTINQIDEWMGNSDPDSPDNLIELFQASSWWLKQLGHEKAYSGSGSVRFWNRVFTLTGPDKMKLYACGVLLQDMEYKVLKWLESAEKKKNEH